MIITILSLLSSIWNILLLRNSLRIVIDSNEILYKQLYKQYTALELLNWIMIRFVGLCLLIIILIMNANNNNNNNNNHHLIISIRIIYCAFQIIVFIVEWYRYFFALQANRLAFIVQYLSLLFIMIETLIIIIQNQLIDGKRSYRIVHMSLPPI